MANVQVFFKGVPVFADEVDVKIEKVYAERAEPGDVEIFTPPRFDPPASFDELQAGDVYLFLPPCADPPFTFTTLAGDTWETTEGVPMSRARYDRNVHKLAKVAK